MTLSKPVQSAVSEYLERELPSICEADATALSKYIVALLNRDQSEDELRSSCSSELKEFLGDTTRSFVKRLFDYLRRKKQQLDSSESALTPVHSGSVSGNGERKRHVEHAVREDDRGHDRYSDKRRRERRDRDVHDGYRESGFVRDDRHRRIPEPEHFDLSLRRSSMEDRRMMPPQQQPPPPHSHRTPAHLRPESYEHRGMRAEGAHGELRHGGGPAARSRDGSHRGFRGGRGGGRHADGGYGRGQRDGADQRSPTNLYIANIPRQLNNLVSLSSHFSRFGEVVNVQIKPNRDIAFVQFRSHEQAKQALACPDAVCGNRFIKVHWARYDPTDKETVLSTSAETSGTGGSGADDELRKLEKEAEVRRERKQLDESIAKKLELLRRFRAMAGRNTERDKIIAKTQAEVDEMQTKLAALPEVPEVESAADAAAESSLKEQLAAAEKEAAKFGLVDEHGNIVSGRGGARGGRGGGRGGAGQGARGGRGGRGGGGARKAMSLDNRTRAVAIRNIKESHCNEKMLRSHLQSFGQIENVEVNAFGANTALVRFGTRHFAQKAMRHGTNMLGNELAITWHEGGAAPVPAVAKAAPSAAAAAATAVSEVRTGCVQHAECCVALLQVGAAVPPSVEIVADQSAVKTSTEYDSDEDDNERSWRR